MEVKSVLPADCYIHLTQLLHLLLYRKVFREPDL